MDTAESVDTTIPSEILSGSESAVAIDANDYDQMITRALHLIELSLDSLDNADTQSKDRAITAMKAARLDLLAAQQAFDGNYAAMRARLG